MEEKLVGNAEFFPTRLAKSDAYLGTIGCCSRWRYCWVGGWCPKSLQSWFRRKFFPLIFLIKCTNDLPFRLNWNHWIVALLGCFFVCVCVWHLSACCLRPDWAEAKNPDWWGTLDLDGVFKCFISAHCSLLFSRCHSLFGFFFSLVAYLVRKVDFIKDVATSGRRRNWKLGLVNQFTVL